MLRLEEYARPRSPEEALALPEEHPHATVLGGMMWLRLQDRTVPYAIGLASAGLDYVKHVDEKIHIGAMASIERARTDEAFARLAADAFAEATEGIVGTQFRNQATVGSSVFFRMGFSDVLCCLLPFDAEVRLAKAGTVPLAEFARMGTVHDVLTEVSLSDTPARAAFEGVRLSATDFSTLNARAVWQDGSWSLAARSLPKRAQLAAEVLECPVSDIVAKGVDTDTSPYDTGAYASSGTYTSGDAVLNAAEELKRKICAQAASWWKVAPDEVTFSEGVVTSADGTQQMNLKELADRAIAFGLNQGHLSGHGANTQLQSPPPFVSGVDEVEVDKAGGKVTLTDYAAVVDCGTVINVPLARVQAEGGLVQGIGMALTEQVVYEARGHMRTDSFMHCKIPSRLDVADMRVEFMPSYEPTGPFGAKSIGEVVNQYALPGDCRRRRPCDRPLRKVASDPAGEGPARRRGRGSFSYCRQSAFRVIREALSSSQPCYEKSPCTRQRL